MSNVANLFGITNLFFSGTNGGLSASGGQLSVSLVGNQTLPSGVTFNRTFVNTTPYTGKSTDYVIGCMFSTGTSGVIVLPSGLTNTIVVKDESGTAHIGNIIISGLPNIERASSYLLAGSGAAVTLYFSSQANGWRIY